MFHKLNRRILSSISVAAITVVGGFAPTTSPVSAQTTNCDRDVSGFPLISSFPSSSTERQFQDEAQRVANAYTSPDVTLTRIDVEQEERFGQTVNVYEYIGVNNEPGGCTVEIDVFDDPRSSGTQVLAEEAEFERPTFEGNVPPAVDAALDQELDRTTDGNADFRDEFAIGNPDGFIERSVRPVTSSTSFTPRLVPSSGAFSTSPNRVIFEIEGRCTVTIPDRISNSDDPGDNLPPNNSDNLPVCSSGDVPELIIEQDGNPRGYERGAS